jgi:hypothetical protein
MRKILLLSLFMVATNIFAGPLEDLKSTLNGRVGSASEDRRTDVHADLGITKVKIGCKGDTLEANVKITGVSGEVVGDTANLTVTYTGKYERQGWDIPCQKVSSDLGGIEKRNLTGTYKFSVTGKVFHKPIITWGAGSNFGEVNSSTHDSNIFAILAVQDAISSAF